VVLRTQPAADVTVHVTTSAQAQAAPAAVTFTANDWNVPRTVTLTATDDDVDEASPLATSVTQAATSSDPTYDGIAVATIGFAVTDDDEAGIEFDSGAATAVSEPATSGSFRVRLASEPTAPVALLLSGTQVTATPTLTFTPADWNTFQTVTVTALDDLVQEASPHAGSVSLDATSTDTDYENLAIATHAVSITDDDVAALVVADTGGATTVTEAGPGTDVVQVSLATEPTADVVVTPAVTLGNARVTVSGALTFTGGPTGTWATPQDVTVTAVDDAVDRDVDPGAIPLTATSPAGDVDYPALAAVVKAVAVTDDDEAGLEFESLAATAVSEPATTGTFRVRLTSQPTAAVSIALSGDQVTTTPTPTFSTANWHAYQTVTVTAVDNLVDDGTHAGSVALDASSTDTTYDDLPVATHDVTVADDDVSALVVADTGGSTSVTEAGPGSDVVKVSLATKPTADVIVTPTVTTGNTRVTVSGALLFTSGNWATPQDVTVTAVNDLADADDDPGSITLTASSPAGDATYASLAPVTRSITVVDDDVPPAIVLDTAAPVASMGQSQYREVSLATEPSGPVTVTASVTGNAGVAIGSVPNGDLSFTFAADEWSTPQLLAMWGSYTDGVCTSGPFSVLLTASGGGIDGVTTTIPGTFTDADCAAGFEVVGADDLAVSEAGATDTFTVRLTSDPYGAVDVSFAGDAEVAVTGGAMHTFDSSNWNVAHTVTVAAVDDGDIDPSDAGSITATTSSSNGSYDAGRIPSPFAVSVTDNDFAPALVDSPPGSTSTDGQNEYHDVSLKTQPSGNVTVSYALTGTATVYAGFVPSVETVEFTPENWASPRQFVTWGSWADGTCSSGTFTATLTATGGGYDGVTHAISGSFVDPDCTSGFVIAGQDSLAVTEGGTTDSFTVRLASRPGYGVTVNFVGNAEVSVTGGATLTFNSGDWSTPKTVTVAAVDDADFDPTDMGSITATSASSQVAYDGTIPSPYAVTVTDNDSAPVAPAFVITDPGAAGIHLVRSGPASETLLVHLNRAPSGPVSVAVAFGSQAVYDSLSMNPSTLSFTTGNWNVDQSVTFTAGTVYYSGCAGGGGGGGLDTGFANFTASGNDFAGLYAQVDGDVSAGTTPPATCQFN
jgi:hypothetical protein